MHDARAKKFNLVAVYKMDRLGRSLAHLLQIVKELSGLGIGVIATSQGIDTTSGGSVGNLVLSVMGAVAEFERELIQERTIAGVESARRRGVKLGRPGTPPEKIARVLELRKQTQPHALKFAEIASVTGLSIGMVHKIVSQNERGPVHKPSPRKTAKPSEGRRGVHKATVL